MIGDPGESVALPAAPEAARALVLGGSGYTGTPRLMVRPAPP